jgi:plastocyanin
VPRYASFMRSIGSTAFVLAVPLVVQMLWAGGQKLTAQFPEAGTGTTPQTFHAVLIKDFKYQPSNLTVKVGDTIEWKNADIVPHTVTAVDRSFDSAAIGTGRSWKSIFRTAGDFNYFCTLHPNMRAKLIVQ